jgi:hypothetical protein
MNAQNFFTSSDTLTADLFLAQGNSTPLSPFGLDPFGLASGAVPLPPGGLALTPQQNDAWTESFVRALQTQHGRVRTFLDQQRERWKLAEAELHAEIERLQAEAQDLRAQCDLLQNHSTVGSSEALDDANRRYQLALDDLRQLDLQNADLQRQLDDGSLDPNVLAAALPALAGSVAKVHDWEAEKRRILACLESDDAADEAAHANPRAKIEEVILRTDRIIAEKNREIAELKHMLETQSNSFGSLAVGAAALGEVLDMDSLIVEERTRLSMLQTDLQDKLRQAEIEISMERARLARREVEIEEKLRGLESRKVAAEPADATLPATSRSMRGRWRAQLGLGDDLPGT